ncbi:MAG: FecR domain-containing protein [Prolixibacteraceae bacterium]|jgi:ferric-dicitrate binding protein FerR (iron transport regulator)|nr:FecR domain-containing protein [Prolixibacteraceae bacterium]
MKNNNDIKPTNWGLIARLLFDNSPNADVSDKIETEGLSEDEKTELLRSRSLRKTIDLYYAQKTYSEINGWRQVQQKIESRKRRKLSAPMFLRVAAAVAVIFLLGVFAYQYYTANDSRLPDQLATLAEPITSFELPDGTKVSLNSDSKLFFPKKFRGKTREITLEGEAFFDVKSDPTKPFIINAGKAQVKVLGTSFNVNAYPGSDKVEVIVETGKVRVVRKSGDTSGTAELILDPGDKGTLLYPNNVLLKSKNSDSNFLAWKTHFLIFRETALGDVVATLEKIYKTDIDIAGHETEKLLLTGQYNDYPLDFIMEVIASTLHLKVKKEGNRFLLSKES